MITKKNMVFLYGAALLILSGCAATRNIYFDAQSPAMLSMPRYIRSLAVIDRSIPENKDLNMLEGIVTGEGMKQDKLATQIVIDGLAQSLQSSTRYHVIRTAEQMKGSGAGGRFPAPLSWEEIEKLCAEYDADAIVSLETYDSDFIVTRGTRKGDKGLQFFADGLVTVNCGFRMYDPSEKNIIDEFHFSHNETWHSGGPTVLAAVGALLQRDEAIKNASYQAGMVYGERVTPSWYRIERDYFTRPRKNPYLAEGARMMEVNDWDRAISALKKALETGDIKTMGRAAHNLAVVNEILGDLEEAKRWASEAWGKFGNRRSRDYGYILTRRINERKLLEQQLKE